MTLTSTTTDVAQPVPPLVTPMKTQPAVYSVSPGVRVTMVTQYRNRNVWQTQPALAFSEMALV